jgi:hypothetical protein
MKKRENVDTLLGRLSDLSREEEKCVFQHTIAAAAAKGSYKKLKPEQCEMCLSTLEERKKRKQQQQLAYDVFVVCDLV